jgi:hypothetical protein
MKVQQFKVANVIILQFKVADASYCNSRLQMFKEIISQDKEAHSFYLQSLHTCCVNIFVPWRPLGELGRRK